MDNFSLFGKSVVLVNTTFAVLISIAIIGMAIAFWHYKKRFKEATTVFSLIILLLSIPVGVALVLNRTNLPQQAAIEIKIEDVVVKKIADTTASVIFKTSSPAIVYLEYKDTYSSQIRTILPIGSLTKKIYHEFTIDQVGIEGGTVTFIVNSKRYFYNNVPLIIK